MVGLVVQTVNNSSPSSLMRRNSSVLVCDAGRSAATRSSKCKTGWFSAYWVMEPFVSPIEFYRRHIMLSLGRQGCYATM
jgi:hypothetical protein